MKSKHINSKYFKGLGDFKNGVTKLFNNLTTLTLIPFLKRLHIYVSAPITYEPQGLFKNLEKMSSFLQCNLDFSKSTHIG